MRLNSPLSLILLIGCGGSTPKDTAEPPVDLLTELSEPGPYGAGYRTSELTWNDAETGDRTLRLAIWYPSTQTEGPDFKYQDLFEAQGAVLDGPIADGPFPVAVFSHGHLAYAEAASFLPVHLASHGWVVLAPDHTNNTTFDGPERQTAIYWQRPLDITAVLDHLDGLQDGDPLAGQLAPGPVLGFGHSFGGYTGFALAGATYDQAGIDTSCAGTTDDPICSDWTPMRARFDTPYTEPRLGGFVSMAAGDYHRFGTAGVSTVSLPILTLTGGLDTGADNDAYWDALQGPEHRRVHLSSAAHNTFSDFSGILDQQPGLMDPDEGFAAIRTYVLAFGLRILGDERGAPALDGELEVHSDATVSQH